MVKESDSVRSPPSLLKDIRREFGKFFDPAPYNPQFDATKHRDGLKIPWKKINYVNPPYSSTSPWFQKAAEEAKKGNTTIMLVKLSALATEYSRKFIKGAEIRIFSKRFSFPGYDGVARFHSALVIWRGRKRSSKYSVV